LVRHTAQSNDFPKYQTVFAIDTKQVNIPYIIDLSFLIKSFLSNLVAYHYLYGDIESEKKRKKAIK